MIISVCKKHGYRLCELCAHERPHESPCIKYRSRSETFQYDCHVIGKDEQKFLTNLKWSTIDDIH